MTQPNRPNFPPQVLEALKRGNKVEAIKLLKEAARVGLGEAKQIVDALEANTKPPAAKQVKQAVKQAVRNTIPHHHPPSAPNPYLLRRPGLSPGEVPHESAGGLGWVALVAGGLLMAYAIISNTPS